MKKYIIGWGLMFLSMIIGFIAFMMWFLGDSVTGKIIMLCCVGFQIFGILTKN